MTPIFSSTYSIGGKSLLNFDKPSLDLDSELFEPVSIFDIAESNGLQDIFLVDTSMVGFPLAHKRSEELGKTLHFGLITPVLIGESENEGYTNQSKIIVFAKNDQGCKDLIKVHFASQPIPQPFNEVKKHITENLFIAIPYYDSFLHVNSLNFSCQIPDLSDVEHLFFYENHGLPFDYILRKNLEEYYKKNKPRVEKVFSIFYDKKDDINSYQTYRCVCDRSRAHGRKLTLSSPNLPHFGSNTFSWEAFENNEQSS